MRAPYGRIFGRVRSMHSSTKQRLFSFEFFPPRTPEARGKLERIRAAPDVRLSCQLRPTQDLSVTPLLPPNVGPQQGFRKTDAHQGREQEIAVLFPVRNAPMLES